MICVYEENYFYQLAYIEATRGLIYKSCTDINGVLLTLLDLFGLDK